MTKYERVRETFHYRSDGTLWHKKFDKKVGSVNSRGYVRVNFEGKNEYAHRLIFLWHHGYIPENQIDHINRDKTDNRIENLREVSQQCNNRNTDVRRGSLSGVKGVTWNRFSEKWVTTIKVHGKNRYLGAWEKQDLIEAVLHRLAAEQCLKWNKCDSDSSAYRFAIENGLNIK